MLCILKDIEPKAQKLPDSGIMVEPKAYDRKVVALNRWIFPLNSCKLFLVSPFSVNLYRDQ